MIMGLRVMNGGYKLELVGGGSDGGWFWSPGNPVGCNNV